MNRMVFAIGFALLTHWAFFNLPVFEEDVLSPPAKQIRSISLQLRTPKVPPAKRFKEASAKKPVIKKTKKTVSKKQEPIPVQRPMTKKSQPLHRNPPKIRPSQSLKTVLPSIQAKAMKTKVADDVLKKMKVPSLGNVSEPLVPAHKMCPAAPPIVNDLVSIILPPEEKNFISKPKTPLIRETIASENIRIAAMQHPVYPRAARRQGREGTVQIKVKVLANGTLGKLEIHNSSGSQDLDQAAVDAVGKWHFSPATEGGTAIAQIAIFPVRFTLK